MSRFNRFVMEAVIRKFNLGENATDFDVVKSLLLNFDYKDIKNIISGMEFSEEELITLSAMDIGFFKDKVSDELKANRDFILKMFEKVLENGEDGYTYFYPVDYLNLISVDLKNDLKFMVKVAEMDGYIALTDDSVKYYSNELFKTAVDNYFKEHLDQLIDIIKDQESLLDYRAESKEEYNAYYDSAKEKEDEFKMSVFSGMVENVEDEINHAEEKINFLKSLNTYKTQIQSV